MDIVLSSSPSQYDDTAVRDTVAYAIRNAIAESKQHKDYYALAVSTFEQQNGLTTEEFMHKFETGLLERNETYFDWFAAKRALDIWTRRFDILSAVSI